MRSAGPAPPRAVLGPTNTGKTHGAIERMLQHRTGMIGLPLRLLAREVYDRLTSSVGEAAVALVTGEEKRIPARPRYWVCTVEAMPEHDVDFVAVDEVQLAAHHERGHVFTDRLLRARGREETWFLGAATMRPIIERLVPTATFERRPRLSVLSAAGSLALGALPPRTAVVAFSAARVYELAERLRSKRGGTAVVTGALSPRARNAQVALYQAGEVDYLVATDAIGMGLNLDVDCVAFADVRKFDGRHARDLEDAELAQIAGRAGRYTNDGRFATLAPLPALPPAVTRAIEQHRFAPVERVRYRNSALDTSSVAALLASLGKRPFAACLSPVADADDTRALEKLSADDDVRARVRAPEHVELLWQVCQIPDYRKLALDDHFQLLRTVFLQLSSGRGRLSPEWMRAELSRIDDPRGDLDTLLLRMASIRTFTYIGHRGAWLDDARAWQERAHAIEDRLSDALHALLVERFVDRGAGRRRPRRQAPATSGRSLGDQLREKGLAFETPTPVVGGGGWTDEVVDAPHERFTFDDAGFVHVDARGERRRIGRVGRGADLLHPSVTLDAKIDFGAGARLRLERRLVAWTRDVVAALLGPLAGDEPLSPAGQGLVYQLERHLGSVRASAAREQLHTLAPRDRAALRARGVRLGRRVVYAPALLSADAVRARALLCAAWLGRGAALVPPPPRAVSLFPAAEVPDDLYTALGFPLFGPRAIRADVAEDAGERAARGDHPAALAQRIGCPIDEIPPIRAALLGAAGIRRRA